MGCMGWMLCDGMWWDGWVLGTGDMGRGQCSAAFWGAYEKFGSHVVAWNLWWIFQLDAYCRTFLGPFGLALIHPPHPFLHELQPQQPQRRQFQNQNQSQASICSMACFWPTLSAPAFFFVALNWIQPNSQSPPAFDVASLARCSVVRPHDVVVLVMHPGHRVPNPGAAQGSALWNCLRAVGKFRMRFDIYITQWVRKGQRRDCR